MPITPPVGGRMAGYALRTEPAQSVNDDLMLRAVLFDDGDTIVVLVVCDLIYATAELTAAIREAIAAELAIPPLSIIVCTTHTHSGPAHLTGVQGTTLREAIAERAKAASRRAHAERQSVDLVLGSRIIPGISANRRTVARCPDATARILIAQAQDTGFPVATILNFACHATVLEHDWCSYSADFPGAACRDIEAAIGGVAVYLQGCAGDTNPVFTAHDWDECCRIGRILATTATQVALEGQGLARGLRTVSPTFQEEFDASALASSTLVPGTPLAVSTTRVHVGAPVALPPPDQIDRERARLAPALENPDVDTRRQAASADSELWIQQLRTDEPNLFGVVDTEAPTLELQALHLGPELSLLALPGEPFAKTDADIRRRADRHVLIAGYANQSAGYLPTRHEFPRGGYEVGCSQYPAGTAEAVVNAAVRLLDEQSGTSDPALPSE
ncbi:hypothetical protein [Segeticoccus rhizosphaerae]|uniref:hypothetical protein n=1 Tax=Segeticoccus rhizosphaerae TaxID=1104777 RepID=UPI001396B6A1|nr:hypothetical protein [Segeticoccus rhizosphaerae]